MELYTDEKNPELEATLEAVLDRHGIFYDLVCKEQPRAVFGSAAVPEP